MAWPRSQPQAPLEILRGAIASCLLCIDNPASAGNHSIGIAPPKLCPISRAGLPMNLSYDILRRCSMITIRKTVLLLAIPLLIVSGPLALAQGTYMQIDDPNAVGQTYCYGVDTAGDIMGYYVDGSGIPHGFLLSAGTYTTIDYPGAT